MIAHVVQHVSDVQKSKEFYLKALAPLGYAVTGEFPEWNLVGMGVGGKSDYWIIGDPADKPTHVAFAADSREAVDEFHTKAIEAGGKDNGAPGYRKDYAPGYYAAFVYDPDGNNIELVYMDPAPTA